MFTTEQKRWIASEVQKILRKTKNPELPEGEIPFLLHVDGDGEDSWANIRNNGDASLEAPENLDRNLQYE